MISYKNRKAVKKLALEYRMPESYIRQMLAIESGEITGDVIEVQGGRPAHSTLKRYGYLFLCVITLGTVSFFRIAH